MTAPEADQAEVEDELASLNSIILTTSLLVLIVMGYRINTYRLRHVPESGAAMALGFVVGVTVRCLKLTEEERLLDFKNELFFYVLLPPIIFEAGLSLEAQMFVDNLGTISAFAVIGTLVSTFVVARGLRWAGELDLIGLERTPHMDLNCYLFGALISATDPVATIALFGGTRFRADPLLHSLINGEAVLNDAVAIVLFTTLSSHMDDQTEPQLVSFSILGHFCFISVGSLVVGLASGAICSWVFCRSRFLAKFPAYEISAMVLVAYLTFAFSQLLGLSGIMALFFFGVVLAQYNWYNLSEHSKVASKVAFGTLAKLAESCVFLYLGVVAALSLGRFHWHLGLVCYSLLVIVVARAAHVFPLSWLLNPCRDRKIPPNMQVVLWISGLRGAIAFALSLRIPCARAPRTSLLERHGSAECRNSDLLITTTISIVMLTTLVVGTAMEKVMMVLRVIEPTAQPNLENQLSSTPSSNSLSVPLAPGSGSGATTPRSMQYRSGDSTATGGISMPSPGQRQGPPGCEASGAPAERSGGPEPPRGAAAASSGPTSGGDQRRAFWSLRFNARGRLYQAFARFDLNVLQPALGGPCRNRSGSAYAFDSSTVELPSLQDFIEQPGMPRHHPTEEEPPAWSRAAVFE